MTLLRTQLGNTLRGHRLRQRRTLRDVSGAARVSLGYLSEVERGQKEASSELLASICDALDVELADLLAEVSLELRGRRRGAVRPPRPRPALPAPRPSRPQQPRRRRSPSPRSRWWAPRPAPRCAAARPSRSRPDPRHAARVLDPGRRCKTGACSRRRRYPASGGPRTSGAAHPRRQRDGPHAAGLLAGAARAFAEQGLRRSTMQSVAAAAGVAKATLYNHFRTKDEVAAALLAAELDRLTALAAALPREQALAALSDELGAHPVLRRLAETEPEIAHRAARRRHASGGRS